MASLIHDKDGRRRIGFKGRDGRPRVLHLGRCNERMAAEVKRRVESILSAVSADLPIDPRDADWLTKITPDLHSRLVKAELASPREAENPRARPLGEYVDAYHARRTDMKPSSRLVLGHVVRNLKAYFGPDRSLASVTAGDADDFQRWLTTGCRERGKADPKAKGLAPATVAKRLQWCTAIFRDAVRRKLLAENPFSEVKQPRGSNPERKVYVPAATIETLIEAAPNSEWKLLIAFARYLGLRTPSEPFSLTWDCIDWARGRIKVPSPKTEVHGKSFRIVPILPQVREHLERCFAEASDGSLWVLEGLRKRASAQEAARGFWGQVNMRQQFLKMIARAGIAAWPKLFHNLRASAQTDLAAKFPIHVVCDWLGNTKAVAQEHYLQTTDADFDAATGLAEMTDRARYAGIHAHRSAASVGK